MGFDLGASFGYFNPIHALPDLQTVLFVAFLIIVFGVVGWFAIDLFSTKVRMIILGKKAKTIWGKKKKKHGRDVLRFGGFLKKKTEIPYPQDKHLLPINKYRDLAVFLEKDGELYPYDLSGEDLETGDDRIMKQAHVMITREIVEKHMDQSWFTKYATPFMLGFFAVILIVLLIVFKETVCGG